MSSGYIYANITVARVITLSLTMNTDIEGLDKSPKTNKKNTIMLRLMPMNMLIPTLVKT